MSRECFLTLLDSKESEDEKAVAGLFRMHRVAVNAVLMKLRCKSPTVLSLDEPVSRNSPSLKREVEKEDLNLRRGAIDGIVLGRGGLQLLGDLMMRVSVNLVRFEDLPGSPWQFFNGVGNSKSQLHKAKMMKMRDLLFPQRNGNSSNMTVRGRVAQRK